MSQQFDFSQILDALQEPFPSQEVEFKPQQISKDGTKALAAAYVDARRYQERLDLVCPEWTSKIELLADGRVAKVSLTIAGVTREDVGEADPSDPNTVTTAVAQAFKRACAAFGLGRYLYFLPLEWVDYDPQRKKLVNPPQLPEWALAPSERLEKATASQPVQEVELADPGAYKMSFGKYNGSTLSEMWQSKEGQGYVRWLASTDGKGFQPRNPTDQHAQRMARAFLSLQSAYAG